MSADQRERLRMARGEVGESRINDVQVVLIAEQFGQILEGGGHSLELALADIAQEPKLGANVLDGLAPFVEGLSIVAALDPFHAPSRASIGAVKTRADRVEAALGDGPRVDARRDRAELGGELIRSRADGPTPFSVDEVEEEVGSQTRTIYFGFYCLVYINNLLPLSMILYQSQQLYLWRL